MNEAQSILLGVNVDHVATIRQARGVNYPQVVQAALVAEQAGADGITIHLREDRRHIQDRDVELVRECINSRLNLEMAVTDEMVAIAKKTQPEYVCLVPEKREEVTTEGGLDVCGNFEKVKQACQELGEQGIKVSLFIDAEERQIEAAQKVGAPFIEIHTGHYADALNESTRKEQYRLICDGVKFAKNCGLMVNAGHGLHYHNVAPIAAIPDIYELNIGHAIIAQSVFSGLATAVADMKKIMLEARR
ncbi:pyridoxine 5'-phosphate synthase [Aliikangiella coralliicola]|uniref:Pyridoxine 5'-phosphate synthase n=1 Tax=Aliikangiella coralliicola TaxID=2592383 RepID=A0A545UB27_9GAMM|nr:pyridoxine 5'-phosphate synthase [Aliikangiella coralliicola]TQV86672.1 pyridoxine 5'-phosphate synthase [Aliikangiella coralliicola]